MGETKPPNNRTEICFVGLGSNLDDPVSQIRTALASIHQLPKTYILGCSSLYQSKPVGPQEQNDFLNAVVKIETGLSPYELLNALQNVENVQGRDRSVVRWGPRSIDLDILLFGQQVIHSETLNIPHSEIENRAFVLIPLAEIAPELTLASQKKIRTLAENCWQDGIMRLRIALWPA